MLKKIAERPEYLKNLKWLITSGSIVMIISAAFIQNWLLLRAGLFLLTFGSGLYGNSTAVCLSVLLLPSLEIPTLLAGLPNQYLIDWVMLGASFHLHQGIWKIKNHILIPSLLLIALGMTVQFIPEFIALFQLADGDLSIFSAFKTLASSFYLWNIESNPFHSISVAFGIFTASFFVIGICNWLSTSPQENRRKLLKYLSFSALVPFIWGILQIPRLGLLPIIYTVDIGGTFQNGNLLSYFAGLIILVQLIALSLQPLPWERALQGVVLILGIFCLFLGQGRTAMLALLLSFAFLIPYVMSSNWKNLWRPKFMIWALLTLIVLSGTIYLLDFGNFSGFLELQEIIKNKNFKAFLFAGGRNDVYRLGYDFISNHWLFGMGQGNFFNKAGLRLELHSIVPDWILGVGLPIVICALLPLVYRVYFVFRSSFQSQKMSRKLILISLIYIFLSTLPDAYFSYRSILAVSLTVLALINPNQLPSLSNKSYLRIVFLVIAIGLASMISPHFRPIVFWNYPAEVQPMATTTPMVSNTKVEYNFAPLATFNWVSLGTRLEIGHECKGILLNSPFQQPGHRIAMRKSDMKDIRPDMSYSEAKKSFESSAEIELAVGKNIWRSLCLCNESNNTKYIDLLSSKGNYIQFSRSLKTPDDLRYIGFKISHFQTDLNPTEAVEPQKLLPIACERINI